MAEQTRRSVAVRITGQVQGVSYRAWTRTEAEARGLSGWVRNEPDGSVTALIDGPGERVEDMIAAMSRGPRPALVEHIEVQEADPAAEGFRILK